MVITVHCPSCKTAFPVDAAKVPEAGVHARCSVCRRVFPVRRPAEVSGDAPQTIPAQEAVAAPGEAEALGAEPVEGRLEDGEAEEEGGAPVLDAPDEAGAELEPPAPPAEAVSAGAGAGGEPAARTAFAFGRADPHERAARLARVLVSDIIVYHPERHARALEEERLQEEFQEEIDKSWKEFVEQIGAPLAESTTYFRDALNEILARGRAIF